MRKLLESGLTVEDVRDVLSLPDTTEPAGPGDCAVKDVALRRLAELDRRIVRLTELRDRLADRYERRFEGILSPRSPEVPAPGVPAGADR